MHPNRSNFGMGRVGHAGSVSGEADDDGIRDRRALEVVMGPLTG